MLMSSTKPSNSGDRFRPSTAMITLYGVIAAALFSASSSAPTPVYHLYQESLGLSPLMLTVIFASYAISLLISLLTVGGLSDYVGRKPMILAALLLNAAAMVIFILASSAIGTGRRPCDPGFCHGRGNDHDGCGTTRQ